MNQNQLPPNGGHSKWSWQSNGYVDKPGSVAPKKGQAECRRCLGVLRCQACELLVRPNTKADDMNAQVSKGCPNRGCGGPLVQIPCIARCYLFVVEEDGIRYSVWEHTGSHSSHPRPPVGRKPPHSRRAPDNVMGRSDAPVDPPTADDRLAEPAQPRQTTPAHAHPWADSNEASTSHGHPGTPTRTREPQTVSVRSAKVSFPPPAQPRQLLRPPRSDDKKKSRRDSSRVLDCAGCGVSGGEEELDDEAMRCDSCNKWSHDVCMQESLELSLRNEDRGWSCPPCRGIEVWRDANIGQYALFRVRPGGKKYAARIDGREGRKGTLTWHFGNVYAAKDVPASPTFSRSARECTEALDDAGLNAVPKSRVGAIRWPLELQEDAFDHDYANDAIQTALYDTYSSVFDMLTGRREHPLMLLFTAHMAVERAKFKQTKGDARREPNADDLLQFASRLTFSTPILHGHASLAQDLLADLKIQISQLPNHNVDDSTVVSVGYLLFQLVILRTYLGRPAENNLDIFDLVRMKQVVRVWTPHEQALAACFGKVNTSTTAIFASVPDPSLWGVKVVSDPRLSVPDLGSLVALQIDPEFAWQDRPGLTGGPHKPRRYKPPHARLVATGSRPKPRPAYQKTKAVNEPNLEAAPSLGLRKRVENEVETAEMPVKKRRSDRLDIQGRVLTSSGQDVENREVPSTCRRTRAMTKSK